MRALALPAVLVYVVFCILAVIDFFEISEHKRNTGIELLSTPRSTQQHQSHSMPNTTNILDYHQGTTVVNGRQVSYRIHPKKLLINASQSLTIGVLSAPQSTSARAAIRSTWARNYPNRNGGIASSVLFLVGGSWGNVSDEFANEQDLLWIDQEESYRSITSKVVVFLAAAQRHWPNQSVMKVDDDTYVRVEAVEDIARSQSHSYWGLCNPRAPVLRKGRWAISTGEFAERKFPPYGVGAGYLISPRTLQCMVRAAQVGSVLPVEDGYVGILARSCRVPCENTQKVKGEPARNVERFFVLHHIGTRGYTMHKVHKSYGKIPRVQK